MSKREELDDALEESIRLSYIAEHAIAIEGKSLRCNEMLAFQASQRKVIKLMEEVAMSVMGNGHS